jgi:hypothetical protein
MWFGRKGFASVVYGLLVLTAEFPRRRDLPPGGTDDEGEDGEHPTVRCAKADSNTASSRSTA